MTKFIGEGQVNRTSFVSPVIELHKMLRAAAPVTFYCDQLGESDKKYDGRPGGWTGEAVQAEDYCSTVFETEEFTRP